MLIMDANKSLEIIQNQKGQSLIEMVVAVPIFLGFVWILFQVNTAIQVSINNQQHSRGQMLHLAFNSPIFPELKFRVAPAGMVENKTDLFIAGTSAEHVEDGTSTVLATVVSVARDAKKVLGESTQSLPVGVRTNVRVRDTVAMCTQRNLAVAGKDTESIGRESGAGFCAP